MTEDELITMALQQTAGDVQAALRLLAQEVIAQMQTGYYRPEPRHETLPIEKAPDPLWMGKG